MKIFCAFIMNYLNRLFSLTHFRQWISRLLCLCVVAGSAHAGMFSTQEVNANIHIENHRQLVQSTLLREDVKQALLAHGVEPQIAQQRVDRLTDEEIQQLAIQFDELPAAGGVGLVLFATGPIVFMLEIMGFTDLTTTF